MKDAVDIGLVSHVDDGSFSFNQMRSSSVGRVTSRSDTVRKQDMNGTR
jgi:hypothetical protein